MRANQKRDKRIHIRKKVAGGTTGAVLGAVMGGPVGAMVGGIIGTVVGSAAESGKLAKLGSTNVPPRGTGAAVKKGAKKMAGKARRSIQRVNVSKPRKRRTGTQARSKSKRS
jgi:hypothetical protein